MQQIIINSKKFGKYILIVDDEDYEFILNLNPFLKVNECSTYAVCYKKVDDKKCYFFIHREIMKRYFNIENKIIDHINHNGLDNRKENLRICTREENSKNITNKAKRTLKSTSCYKGVSFNAYLNKWEGSITNKYKKIYIGQFDSEEQAALAYDQMARYLFGEFACLNFPERNENIIDVEKILNKKKHMTSKYLGVYWHKQSKKWVSHISVDKTQVYLGIFKNEVDAAKAYNDFITKNNLSKEKNIINDKG